MYLSEFLKSRGTDKTKFSRFLGVNRQTLQNFFRGQCLSLRTAILIEEKTLREISCRELLEEFEAIRMVKGID